jgi:hypothetical protein
MLSEVVMAVVVIAMAGVAALVLRVVVEVRAQGDAEQAALGGVVDGQVQHRLHGAVLDALDHAGVLFHDQQVADEARLRRVNREGASAVPVQRSLDYAELVFGGSVGGVTNALRSYGS